MRRRESSSGSSTRDVEGLGGEADDGRDDPGVVPSGQCATRGSDDAGARVVERRDELVEEAVRIQATDRDDRSPTALCTWIIEERRYECPICASPTLSETNERDLVGAQPLPVVRSRCPRRAVALLPAR